MPSNEIPETSRVTVVGIGASAGGIDALRRLFAIVPVDLNVAYVVIVHLAPDYESELASILGRTTKMSVVEVRDHQQLMLTPNCVYVIAPDRKLVIAGNTIAAGSFRDVPERRAAIDVFFRSLAESYGDAFAVILSGGGSDGSLGARAVKEAGGVVLVQDPDEAAHEAMPRSVIAAGVADIVAPVAELVARLVDLVRHGKAVAALREPRAVGAETDEVLLRRILEIVRVRTGHDFARYKRPTILRRLARRMQLNHRASFEPYLALLREHPPEIQSLFDDLLISVTTFFRDPAVWEALRTQVVMPLVERATGDEAIRIWVPGCATGEEAYSLAILFREELSRRHVRAEVVIFASDVDQASLATAREGLYPAAIAADVSEARLGQYFRKEGDHYRVTNEIRDLVVFAVHSVLRDPPFSKLHLLSCRNLLIYLERELQQQLQDVFRYALRDDGFLMIGISETADAELFEPLDKPHHLFRARPRLAGRPIRLPQLPDAPHVPITMDAVRERSARSHRSVAETHIEALEELAPPSLLIDEHGNVEHLSAGAGRFLQPRGGPPSRTLVELVRPELAVELRAVLNRALELHEPCLSAFVPVRFNGTPKLVGALVQPRRRGDERTQELLITFLEAGDADKPPARGHAESTDTLVLDLREKLRIAEQRLETMRQEHSLAYEDLRAVNEELQTLNEEYRSTAEELETSREELQSVNEELQTVNNELKVKLEEASRVNNDLENFMAATEVATLFLDRALCIKRYTTPLRQFLNVKQQDLGRPIADLTHNLLYDDLVKDAARVLVDVAPIERFVETREGEALIVRVRPYRTAEEKIDGAVITFAKR